MRTQLPEKLYYSIGEVSEAFDVNPSLIRFWEKEFEHLTPKKKMQEVHESLPHRTLIRLN